LRSRGSFGLIEFPDGGGSRLYSENRISFSLSFGSQYLLMGASGTDALSMEPNQKTTLYSGVESWTGTEFATDG